MHECTFVILGATGDLTKRKLIPAFYRLIKHKEISKYVLVGVALDQKEVGEILNASKKFITTKVDGRVWKKLERSFYYLQGDFHEKKTYIELKNLLKTVEKKHKLKGKRVFHLATMPQHFATITKNLSMSGIVNGNNKTISQTKWSRIVYEKPFGFDLQSARSINRSVKKVFDESQIYRIDHYLGKELIGNIALIRFTNRVFEPLWNNKHIESVQIILSEKDGIDGRGEFYDQTGAIKDMMQSHMLQIMALVGMESPSQLTGKFIRDAKAKILKIIKVQSLVVGQYEGYRGEEGVREASTTETFAAASLTIDNRRWRGVPFYLKTGKGLDKKEISIHLKFKKIECLLSEKCPSDTNYLTIRVQPEEGFFLELNAKVPGKNEVVPVKMDFCHSCLFGANTPAAYENVLLDVLRGDQSAFVRSDEIESSWKVVEKLQKKRGKLHRYKKGSAGPEEMNKLEKNKIIRWRS